MTIVPRSITTHKLNEWLKEGYVTALYPCPHSSDSFVDACKTCPGKLVESMDGCGWVHSNGQLTNEVEFELLRPESQSPKDINIMEFM